MFVVVFFNILRDILPETLKNVGRLSHISKPSNISCMGRPGYNYV